MNICSCDIDLTQEAGAGGVLTGFAACVELLIDSAEEAKKSEQQLSERLPDGSQLGKVA